MKLMTKALEKKIPALYSMEEKDAEEVRVYAKFFHPFSSWTWYATEYDPAKKIFFGAVNGHEMELGPFSLEELEGIKLGGLPMERDLYWDDTTTLSEVLMGDKS